MVDIRSVEQKSMSCENDLSVKPKGSVWRIIRVEVMV